MVVGKFLSDPSASCFLPVLTFQLTYAFPDRLLPVFENASKLAKALGSAQLSSKLLPEICHSRLVDSSPLDAVFHDFDQWNHWNPILCLRTDFSNRVKQEHESKQCLAITFESVSSMVAAKELFPTLVIGASDLDVNRLVSRGEPCPIRAVRPDSDRVIMRVSERGRSRGEQFLLRHALLDHHTGEVKRRGRLVDPGLKTRNQVQLDQVMDDLGGVRAGKFSSELVYCEGLIAKDFANPATELHITVHEFSIPLW